MMMEDSPPQLHLHDVGVAEAAREPPLKQPRGGESLEIPNSLASIFAQSCLQAAATTHEKALQDALLFLVKGTVPQHSAQRARMLEAYRLALSHHTEHTRA